MGSKTASLFPDAETERRADRPLADRMRPSQWGDFAASENFDAGLLAQLRSGAGKPPSMILWGPPGCGKTTFARLVGSSFRGEFVEFSAVLVGVKEIREAAARAKQRPQLTIVFLDEIHRLNKGQQDAFLPHVESGTFVLIGATTENPSFCLSGALLSRCRVVVFPALTHTVISSLVQRAAAALKLAIDQAACDLIAAACGGDARRALNILEAFIESRVREGERGFVSAADLSNFLKGSGEFQYDRSADEHYNMASAFIKSMRGSDPDAALFWCFRMIESGEDPRFLIRRMMIFASEDVGNADPRGLQLAVATSDAFERLGMPEGRIPIAQCVTYLASAPKSNCSYAAMGKVLKAVHAHPRVTVPVHLRNAPTELMKSLGYGEGYDYPHDHAAAFVAGVQYLPDEVKGQVFYVPSSHGYERTIAERLMLLRQASGDEGSKS